MDAKAASLKKMADEKVEEAVQQGEKGIEGMDVPDETKIDLRKRLKEISEAEPDPDVEALNRKLESILPGITRHCVFTLAREFGIRIQQHMIPRETLYIADEVFFSGTAAEITPVTKIDNIVVGDGRRGPVTERIQAEFFAVIEGKTEDRHGWLTPVV